MVLFSQADINTGNALQYTNASFHLNHYQFQLTAHVYSMLPVRTNHSIAVFYTELLSSCYIKYLGKCLMAMCQMTC